MAIKKPREPKAVITVRYYDDNIVADIENFGNLNARKIQQSIEVVLRRWSELQTRARSRKSHDEREAQDE